MNPRRWLAALSTLVAIVTLAACGSAANTPAGGQSGYGGSQAAGRLRSHPQAVDPTAGEFLPSYESTTPIGDPNAHAPSLAEDKRELKIVQELNSLNAGQGVVVPIATRS